MRTAQAQLREPRGADSGFQRSLIYRAAAIRQRQTAAREVLPQVRLKLLASAERLDSLADCWRPSPIEAPPEPLPAQVRGLGGKIAIRTPSGEVLVDGKPIRLTRNELTVLRLLIERRGSLVSKPEIYRSLYGERGDAHSKIIDVLICTLRKKLNNALGGSACISNVRGRGYVMPA